MRHLVPAAVILMAGLTLALCPSPVRAAAMAFDHAGNPPYFNGWQNLDNGGYGLGPWFLSGGTFEIRSSTGNNSHPPPPPGGTSTAPASGLGRSRTRFLHICPSRRAR